MRPGWRRGVNVKKRLGGDRPSCLTLMLRAVKRGAWQIVILTNRPQAAAGYSHGGR
jgi:hypothetical protein